MLHFKWYNNSSGIWEPFTAETLAEAEEKRWDRHFRRSNEKKVEGGGDEDGHRG